MKGWLILYAVLTGLALSAAAGCNAGDDTTDGTRARCGTGGALTSCPDPARTAEAACWKLVDCGVIPLNRDQADGFDWGLCVDGIQRQTADIEGLIISCIAASSCDALIVEGSPQRPRVDLIHCLRIGAS